MTNELNMNVDVPVFSSEKRKIGKNKGNPFSVILKFSLPVIGGNLFQLFYT